MELRRQIKDAILKGLTPMKSFWSCGTARSFGHKPSKSTFVTMQSGSSFSGKRALLYQPSLSNGQSVRMRNVSNVSSGNIAASKCTAVRKCIAMCLW